MLTAEVEAWGVVAANAMGVTTLITTVQINKICINCLFFIHFFSRFFIIVKNWVSAIKEFIE
jgi:hypothetical protein